MEVGVRSAGGLSCCWPVAASFGRAPGMRPFKYQPAVRLCRSEVGGLAAEPPLHVRYLAVAAGYRGAGRRGSEGDDRRVLHW